MKKIFVIAFLFIFSVPAFSAVRYVTTSTPVPHSYRTMPHYNTINRPYTHVRRNRYNTPRKIRKYNKYRDYNRYNNGLNSYYPGTSTYYTTGNSTGGLGGFFHNLKTSFFGTPTGLTPPVNPYYSYGPNSYGSNYGDYQDYYGNRGWAIRNKQIGTGTGVQILD